MAVRPVRIVVTTFDDVEAAGDAYRKGCIVELVVRAGSEETDHRVVAFASGVVYGTKGSMERIRVGAYLMIPPAGHGHGLAGEREPRDPSPVSSSSGALAREPI